MQEPGDFNKKKQKTWNEAIMSFRINKSLRKAVQKVRFRGNLKKVKVIL